MKDTYTHAQLCEQAGQWLQQQGWSPVITDVRKLYARELPDALAWHGTTSLMIECKRTREDFRRDFHKYSRKRTASIGVYRWFLCPEGLIEPSEIADESLWGLLYAMSDGVVEVKQAIPHKPFQVDREDELFILLHHCRQLDRKPDKAPVDVSLMKLTEAVQAILIQHGPLPAREIRSAMNCKTSPSKLAKRLQEAGFPCADEGGIRIFSAKD